MLLVFLKTITADRKLKQKQRSDMYGFAVVVVCDRKCREKRKTFL